MVESEKSGVLFTANPATGDRGSIVIEGAFGLGEVVVLGEVTPDRYEVDKVTRRITARALGDKRFMLVRERSTGKNVRVALAADRASAPVLDDAEVASLAELGARLEAHYHVPQDAEWAIAGGRVFLVQTRPITTLAARREGLPGGELAGASSESGSAAPGSPDGAAPSGSREASPTGGPTHGQLLVRGLSASPGRATGRVRVLASASAAGTLLDGEVLVAPTTTPDWVPIMRRAAAIVTDAGGMTSHAAIVSRELGIPCVVGTRDGTQKLTRRHAGHRGRWKRSGHLRRRGGDRRAG
jgi:pyruvate,water dikinase